MNILSKLNLFLLGALFFVGYMYCSGSSASAMNDESSDMQESAIHSKKNPPIKKEESKKSAEDFLNKIKNLPKESLEKADNARLSESVRYREDKFWIDKKGNRILLESK